MRWFSDSMKAATRRKTSGRSVTVTVPVEADTETRPKPGVTMVSRVLVMSAIMLVSNSSPVDCSDPSELKLPDCCPLELELEPDDEAPPPDLTTVSILVLPGMAYRYKTRVSR